MELDIDKIIASIIEDLILLAQTDSLISYLTLLLVLCTAYLGRAWPRNVLSIGYFNFNTACFCE